MAIQEAIAFVESVERCTSRVSYERSCFREYVALVRDFFDRADRFCKEYDGKCYWPFVDSTVGLSCDVPQELSDRVRQSLSCRHYVSELKRAVMCHLKYLCCKEALDEYERELRDVYSPMIELLLRGVEWYPDQGGIALEDAGTVMYGCRR